jgi:S1-C subfamily serine protease
MKAYQVSGKQLILLAMMTAVFAGSVVVFYDRFGPDLLGRFAGAKSKVAEPPVSRISDPSVATDEQNNEEVYRAMSPGVVNITTTMEVRDLFYAYQQEGSGSGSVIDKEGHILTNFHVVRGASKLTVTLANSKEGYPGEIVGHDEDNDLAIIRIKTSRDNLTPIPLGSSKELIVGQKVLAIGNPFGLDRTLTTGIVSGLARPLRSEVTDRLIEGVIQTDAAINPGNSGGPLLDSHGRMIGINTMIYTPQGPGGGSIGIGFAVPVDNAKKIIPDLLAYGRVRRPILGISPVPLDARLAQALDLPVDEGLLVSTVLPGSAAARAGIKGGTQPALLQRTRIQIGGDVIVSVDGQPVKSKDDLDKILSGKAIGDKVAVEVVRSGRRLKLEVLLAEAPRQRG